MNAAILVDGSPTEEQTAPECASSSFGSRSPTAHVQPFRRSPLDIFLGRWTLDMSPVFIAFDLLARIFSPYDLNPRGSTL